MLSRGQPILRKLHALLLSPRGSRATLYPAPPPQKKGQELGWAGLAVVTLVFCLQRDLGRREQRAEGGLTSHSEYPLSFRSLAWSFRHVNIPHSLVDSRDLPVILGNVIIRNRCYREGLLICWKDILHQGRRILNLVSDSTPLVSLCSVLLVTLLKRVRRGRGQILQELQVWLERPGTGPCPQNSWHSVWDGD